MNRPWRRPREINEDIDDGSVRFSRSPSPQRSPNRYSPRNSPGRNSPRASPRYNSPGPLRSPSRSPRGDAVGRRISQRGDIWDDRQPSRTAFTRSQSPLGRDRSPRSGSPERSPRVAPDRPSPRAGTPPGSEGRRLGSPGPNVYGRAGGRGDTPKRNRADSPTGGLTPRGGKDQAFNLSSVHNYGLKRPVNDNAHRGPGGIYFEHEVTKVSAVHCINNLLQEQLIAEEHLKKGAEQLDRSVARLMGGRSTDYKNQRKDGYFNVQVLQAVLSGLGYEVHSVQGTRFLEGETGFVLNKNRHWWAVRRIGTSWFDVNPCLAGPEHYDAVDMQEHLLNAQSQDYNIYVVRGEWPPTPLDEDGEKMDAAIQGCMRALGQAKEHEIDCTPDLIQMADEWELPKEYTVPAIWKFGAYWFGGGAFQEGRDDIPEGADEKQLEEIELGFGNKKALAKKPALADASIEDDPEEEKHKFHVSNTLAHLDSGKGMHHTHHDDEEHLDVGGKVNKKHGALAHSREDIAFRAQQDSLRNPGEYQSKKSGLGGMFDETMRKLDADGDGNFNLSDIDDLFDADVEGDETTEEATTILPLFMFAQMMAAVGFWVTMAIKKKGSDFLFTIAGLESVYPGYTSVLVTHNCVNHTWDVWRWLTYQFTHTSVCHIGMNTFITLTAGIPLEMFQGHIRTFLLWNAGVIAGALASMAWNVRSELVGMSAGCYALLGIHMAELMMNWAQSRFRYPKIALLIFMVGLDTLNMQLTQHSEYAHAVSSIMATSHSAHIAGFLSGLLGGVLLSRNLVVTRLEIWLMRLSALFLVIITGFHLFWMSAWPPRSMDDPEPWCWIGQVFNQTFFGDFDYHCVKCGGFDCIDWWQTNNRWVQDVAYEICTYEYDFWAAPANFTIDIPTVDKHSSFFGR